MASKKTKQQLLDEISTWGHNDGMEMLPTIKNTKADILAYYEKYRNVAPSDLTEIYAEIAADIGQEGENSIEKGGPPEEKKIVIKAKRNPPENGYSCYDIIVSHLKVSKDPFCFFYMKDGDRAIMHEDMKKWHASRYGHIPEAQRPVIKYGKLDYKTFFRDVISAQEGKLTTLKDVYDRYHV